MCYITHSLRFTSGATPTDLFAASMAAEPSLPHTCKALVGLETRSYHAAAHSVRSGRPDALPTELSPRHLDFMYNLLISCNKYWVVEVSPGGSDARVPRRKSNALCPYTNLLH